MEGLAFMTFLVKKQTWAIAPSLGKGEGVSKYSLVICRRLGGRWRTRTCLVKPRAQIRPYHHHPCPSCFPSHVPLSITKWCRRTMKRLFSCILQFDHLYGVLRPPRGHRQIEKSWLIPLHFAARDYINHDARPLVQGGLQCT